MLMIIDASREKNNHKLLETHGQLSKENTKRVKTNKEVKKRKKEREK